MSRCLEKEKDEEQGGTHQNVEWTEQIVSWASLGTVAKAEFHFLNFSFVFNVGEC